VEVLGTLDDKIAINTHINHTLNASAQALYKSWFIDFDPVRAKAAGQPLRGLDSRTADLFPEKFQNSTLGPIPDGWRVLSLDQVATYLNGLALQKYPPTGDASLPVIKIAQLRAGSTEGGDRANLNIPPEYIVHDGDVLFSWSGSLEVEIWCGGPGALNQHLFKVTSHNSPKWFYFLWTRHHLADFRAVAASKATTMGHIQRHHLTAAKVLVPPKDLLNAMSAIFDPLLSQFIANNLECGTLAASRDALLPKLLSGEVRTPT
jgi:type I restriction enzyme S subunit